MRRAFQAGKRPGRRAKLAATGHGAGAGAGARGLRTCIYRGRLGPRREAATDVTLEGQTGCGEGRSSAWQPGGTYSTLTHTCIHAHSALTFILHVPPLMLTYMRALTSGSWLRFWRVEPPRLHLSIEPFSRPHITPRSPRLCPRTDTWLPTVLGVGCFLARPWWPQALGGGQGATGLREFRRGLNS